LDEKIDLGGKDISFEEFIFIQGKEVRSRIKDRSEDRSGEKIYLKQEVYRLKKLYLGEDVSQIKVGSRMNRYTLDRSISFEEDRSQMNKYTLCEYKFFE